MKYKLDSEIAAALTSLAAQADAVPVPERGDWKALRDRGNAAHALWAAASPSYPNVETKSFFTESVDGAGSSFDGMKRKAPGPAQPLSMRMAAA